jgi:hypothetical protein
LQETNAAHAAALHTMPEQQMTPQQPNPTPPPDGTQSEGKSCVAQLSNTEMKQKLDHVSPTQKCTHTHASQTLLTQSDCSEIAENEVSGNLLDPTVVPSHKSVSVSVLDSSDNTCNTKKQHNSHTRTSFQTVCLGKVKLASRQ